MTREELQALRNRHKNALLSRTAPDSAIRVTVHMGTSGIHAGARDTVAAFIDAADKYDVSNMVVRQSGQEQAYGQEPVVTVEKPGDDPVMYRRVTAATVDEIMTRHIIKGHVVTDKLYTTSQRQGRAE